ncbi:hypothetical protein [Nocardia sp. CA-145437]
MFNSTYDIRTLLTAMTRLRDGDPIDLPGPELLWRGVAKRLGNNETASC